MTHRITYDKPNGRPSAYVARCSCGWRDEGRFYPGDAEQRGRDHVEQMSLVEAIEAGDVTIADLIG